MRSSVIVAIVVIVIAILGAGVYALTLSGTTTTTTTNTTSSLTTSGSCAPYNIGIMEDETGAVAGFANESIHMAQIAVNQIDAAGGVNCHQLKLYSASEVPSASAAANTLVLQDNVSALVGITYAGDAVALFPFLSAHHVITIMATASNNGLLQNLTTDYSAYQYFFRITPTDTEMAQSVINFTKTVIKPSSFYFVAEDLDFSHELFTNMSSFASSAGITVAGSTFVPLSQTDFTTTASTVAAANPGVVIDCQTGSGAGSFIQDLKADSPNIKVLYMCNGALADPGFQGYLESTDHTLLNGVVFQIEAGTATVPVNNVTTYLSNQYTSVMGPFYPYYSFVSNDYSAVIDLAAALKSAGVSNTTAIISALTTVSTLGPTGLIQLNSAQHIWTPDFWYTQIQNETEKVITPGAFANGSYNATA